METLGAITKIKRLRSQRMAKVNSLQSQIDKISNESMYSEEYKNETVYGLKSDMMAIQQEYDNQIQEEVTSHIDRLNKAYENAEYAGLSDGEATKALLKELRNQEETKALIARFKDDTQGGENHNLYRLAQEKVQSNAPDAPAYINALKQLNVSSFGVGELEEIYKNQNLTSEQKQIQKDIGLIEEQKQEWVNERDTNGINPFAHAFGQY